VQLGILSSNRYWIGITLLELPLMSRISDRDTGGHDVPGEGLTLHPVFLRRSSGSVKVAYCPPRKSAHSAYRASAEQKQTGALILPRDEGRIASTWKPRSSMPVDLHFICPHQHQWTKLGPNLFETGNWTIAERTANEAIGGRIYLHERQRISAWHGGTITRWRRSDEPGRLIFTYEVDGPFRVTCTEGWGQERAIVRR
jgi:hypothetical protein